MQGGQGASVQHGLAPIQRQTSAGCRRQGTYGGRISILLYFMFTGCLVDGRYTGLCPAMFLFRYFFGWFAFGSV